jgi:hypothetical protein
VTSPISRVYVGTFTVAEGVVIVDLILRLHGMLGLSGDYALTITHKGETEAVAGPIPQELLDVDDLGPCSLAAVAFAINQMRFQGFVGKVEYVHHGLFPSEGLEAVLEHNNRHQRTVILSGASASVH